MSKLEPFYDQYSRLSKLSKHRIAGYMSSERLHTHRKGRSEKPRTFSYVFKYVRGNVLYSEQL